MGQQTHVLTCGCKITFLHGIVNMEPCQLHKAAQKLLDVVLDALYAGSDLDLGAWMEGARTVTAIALKRK